MKTLIIATAPTAYQLNSLRAFNLNDKRNGNGSFTGSLEFGDEEKAKEYLRKRAEKYNDEDPCGTEERLADMMKDIEYGCLTLDAVTARIETIEDEE